MKFGGTSVKDADAIIRLSDIIRSHNDRKFIVVSAQAGITDKIVNIIGSLKNSKIEDAYDLIEQTRKQHIITAQNLNLKKSVISKIEQKIEELRNIIFALSILGEVSPKSQDKLLSFGEDLSVLIIYEYLLKKSENVKFIDSRLLIKTDDEYTSANIDFKATEEAVKNQLSINSEFDVYLTQGFVASNKYGDTTTLGRGGSDYSASVIASVLNADELRIYTDVDGILTSDPRYIKNVKLIKRLSYDEASELAYFGAKVLHPKTIMPAVDKNIPVIVLNTFNPNKSGTTIIKSKSGINIIKAIAFRKNVTVINIISNRMLGAYGFLSKVFEVFNKYHTSVDIVTTSEVSISLTIDDTKNLKSIVDELEKIAKISVRKNMAIVSAIGEGIRNTAGIAARFFGILRGINITMVSIGASEVNLSIVLAEKDLLNAVQLLHNEFLNDVKQYDIFANLN